ncbi:MAG: TrkA family potassium uptake protein [Clostridia bacterium]|nr:TrkA family potassium uptake protein [Clostridia bacterium]
MKTFLIIGLGNFGHLLTRAFAKQKCELMVVDVNESALEDVLDLGVSAKIGDCTNPETLRSFDVGSFDACFVCVGDDFKTSLEITSLLKELGAVEVFSKAMEDIQEKFLLRNGADHIIYPEREAAESIAVSMCNDSIFDCIPLADGFNVYEIEAPGKWTGKTIGDVNVRSKYNVSILAVVKDGRISPMPTVDYVFKAEEHLIVLGNSESIRSVTDGAR